VYKPAVSSDLYSLTHIVVRTPNEEDHSYPDHLSLSLAELSIMKVLLQQMMGQNGLLPQALESRFAKFILQINGPLDAFESKRRSLVKQYGKVVGGEIKVEPQHHDHVVNVLTTGLSQEVRVTFIPTHVNEVPQRVRVSALDWTVLKPLFIGPAPMFSPAQVSLNRLYRTQSLILGLAKVKLPAEHAAILEPTIDSISKVLTTARDLVRSNVTEIAEQHGQVPPDEGTLVSEDDDAAADPAEDTRPLKKVIVLNIDQVSKELYARLAAAGVPVVLQEPHTAERAEDSEPNNPEVLAMVTETVDKVYGADVTIATCPSLLGLLTECNVSLTDQQKQDLSYLFDLTNQ
jgi:hypothetical protein